MLEPKNSFYLDVQDLSKFFTLHHLGGKRVTGFTDVRFQLRKGEFLGITGPIGTGKSSLLNCLYRTYLPSQGKILLHLHDRRVDVATVPEHEIIHLRRYEIGFISQSFRRLPRVSAVDLVAEPLVTNGIGLTAAREKAKKMLGQLLVAEELWDISPANFGVGEAQCVNFARTLIFGPKLLLLDEPTSLLDAETSEIIVHMLHVLKHEGVTIIGAFREIDIIRQLTDKVLLMEKNRVSDYGPTAAVVAKLLSRKETGGRDR